MSKTPSESAKAFLEEIHRRLDTFGGFRITSEDVRRLVALAEQGMKDAEALDEVSRKFGVEAMIFSREVLSQHNTLLDTLFPTKK